MKRKSAYLLLSLAVSAPPAIHGRMPAPETSSLVAHTSNYVVVSQNKNSISGHVFSPTRLPLRDIYVELMNDVYSTLGQVKTDGSGYFNFPGLPDGTFKVRVKPYGTDYAEETRDVQLATVSIISGGGAVNEQIEFYLRVRPGLTSGPLAAPGTIFAQNVPKDAQKLYETGVASLRDKKDKEGFESLKRALEIFPDYYLALDRLGTEYVVRGHHEAAFILLTKAIEVNPKSFSSMYGLGMAQYNLKMTDKAIESLQKANTLYGKHVGSQAYLGMAYKRAGKLAEAEKAFKLANELGEGKVANVHWQLAGLYSDQKRYAEAATELELFLKHQPDTRDTEKIKQTIKQLRDKAAAR
ncbi:MAG TPA: tetratricopeptide repeat protein [Pyrinomonadaceae bacterium]|nr:tetratricopeptide repeat protein [Pyrinomonadaceae bacterium]